MLLYSLVYFNRYSTITQLSIHIFNEFVDSIYTRELFIEQLQLGKNINVCKRFANISEHKGVLGKYIFRFDDIEWSKLVLSFPKISIQCKSVCDILLFCASHDLVRQFEVVVRDFEMYYTII